MNKGNIIKETNLMKLRQILRKERICTKSQLSELSGLSVVTVQSLVKVLLENDEISEDMVIQPQLGRPAASFRYNAGHHLALIVNMYEVQGKDSAEYTVYNLFGEVLENRLEHISPMMLESCRDTIDTLIAAYPAICVIGFGIPGEELGGKLILSDYEMLQDAELSSYYESRYHIPVFVENDINAALLGYCVNHGYQPEDDFYTAGLYIPSKYPAGAGLCHNFHILKGKNGLAGELRSLPLGIDWNTFSFSRKELEDFAVKVIQILISIYNPDRIVVYSEAVSSDITDRIRQIYTSKLELLMLPEIEICTSLQTDINMGLIRMALERIL